MVELSFQFGFSATNNQEVYKVVTPGHNLAQDLGAREVQGKTDSRLVVSEVGATHK